MTKKQKEIEKLNLELKASNVAITQHETKIAELSQKSSNSKELVDNALTYNNKLQEKLNELKTENYQINVEKQIQDLKINDWNSKLKSFEIQIQMYNENSQLKTQVEIDMGDGLEQIDLVQQEVKSLGAHNTNLAKTLQKKDFLINEQ